MIMGILLCLFLDILCGYLIAAAALYVGAFVLILWLAVKLLRFLVGLVSGKSKTDKSGE